MNKSAEFEKLQKKWDKRLKDSGFDDIEQRNDGNLKTWSYKFQRYWSAEAFSAKEDYFRMASHFLYDHTFDSTTEKRIWAMHTEATSYRAIAIAMRRYRVKVNKDSVNVIIKRLSKLMLERYRNHE